MTSVPVTARLSSSRPVRIDRHHAGSGRWVRIAGDPGAVRVEVGGTGNRLDPDRRVRLAGHEFTVAGRRAVLRSWWPVREVITHRTGQYVADLRGELAASGSPDPDADLRELDRALALLLGQDPVDGPAESICRRVLVAAYPLLDRPLAAGASPEIVPVAAEALLRHGEPRAAVRAALGPRVTRPLVRALAHALMPDEHRRIVWEPVLCALMAAASCGPEQLTAVLTTPVHRPGAIRFTVTDVDRARAMFVGRDPRRVAERLRTALAEDGGTAALLREITEWDARPPAPPRPPPGVGPPPERRPAAPAIRDPALEPIRYPASWRAVEGREVAGHRVVLPVTADELVRWGQQMDNCLGAYRHAVATGRTRIMGMADAGGGLRMAAEISSGRVLRQLEAGGNTPPARHTAVHVVAFLRANRLIDADARRPV